MIYAVVGENGFVREHEVARIVAGRSVDVFDGAELELRDLSDVLATQTLFSGERVVVLRGVGASKSLSDALTEQIERVDDALTLVLVEAKLDKRTKLYKFLQKQAQLVTCEFWSERQTAKAEAWLADYAKQRTVQLDRALLRDMVRRAIRPSDVDEKPIIDQQLLASAVDQVALLEKPIDAEVIEAVLPAVSHDNVFGLLAAALDGDDSKVRSMLAHLRHNQAGQRLLALLASQATNLAMLALAANRSVTEVATDIGAHPYALQQLAPLAERVDRRTAQHMLEALTRADMRAKSGAEVWGVIETALLTIALQSKQPH